jgi:tetratricopeptide (TPR) repeat protein
MVRPPAAGYDSSVAGLDEAGARAALADMQDRLARDPIAALGIAASATPADARAAFLQLTKKYHPVRFGRMATDVQKLANEVFLALRAAHDTAARTLRRPTIPIAAPPLPPAPPGSSRGAIVNGRAGQGPPPRPGRPAGPPDLDPRQSPPRGMPITPVPRPAAPRPPGPLPPPAPRPATPAPAPARPAETAPASARDEAVVLDLLQRQQWDQARSALHQLSARDPSSKRIRALVCYARGREAQLDRRLDDARVELQEALELDPDLQVAKTALTELFTRRK